MGFSFDFLFPEINQEKIKTDLTVPSYYQEYICQFADPLFITSDKVDIIYHERCMNGATLGNVVFIVKEAVRILPQAQKQLSILIYMLKGSIKVSQSIDTICLYQGQYVILQLDTQPLEASLVPGIYEIQFVEYSPTVLRDLEHSSALAAKWASQLDRNASALITPPGILFPEMYNLHRTLKRSVINTELREHWLFYKLKELLIISLENKEVQQVQNANHQMLVETIKSYLHNNLCQANEMTIGQLAKAYNMSGITLRRFIVANFKMSYSSYLLNIRMEKAQVLLRDSCGKPDIADIAYEIGYLDPAAFSKKFKQYTGKTPKAFWAAYNLVPGTKQE